MANQQPVENPLSDSKIIFVCLVSNGICFPSLIKIMVRNFQEKKSEYFQYICHIDQRSNTKVNRGACHRKQEISLTKKKQTAPPVMNKSTPLFLYIYREKKAK
jgi:hypothetical protein